MNVVEFQSLVDMATKHEEAVSCYLKIILERWTLILRPVKHLDVISDPASVEALAGLWPASNTRDRQRVDKLFSRHDFFPSIQVPQSRAALRQELLSLDGRVLTLSMLLKELRLLRQASNIKSSLNVERSEESHTFDPTYWSKWAARFAALCSTV